MTESNQHAKMRHREADRLVARLMHQRSAGVDAEALLAGTYARLAARRRRWLAAGSLAAAAVIVAVVSLAVRFASPVAHPPPGGVVLGNGAEVRAVAEGPVALADGSVMRVSVGTRYRLKSRSPGEPAVEVLSGRAVFDVAKKDGLPFVVAAPNCRAVALGTSFMVDASEFSPSMESETGMSVMRAVRGAVIVAVFSGLVDLSNPHGSLRLGGGSVALADDKAAPAKLEKDLGSGVGLTVYSGGFGVIKERRELDLTKGIGELKFVGVAKTIDATSVHFISLSDPAGVSVLDQNYEYDLVSPDKILDKYLDKEIAVVVKGSGDEKSTTVKGVLQSFQGDMLTLLVDGKVRLVSRDSIQDLQLGELPGGLITRPTLVWKTQSANGGKHLCKIGYMADAIGWKTDYTAVLNAKDTAIDLAGWVTISNNSGAGYKDAQLKLIAGDVRRMQAIPREGLARRRYVDDKADVARGFEEKSFGEYHMYTLPRPATVNDNQVKQIELIDPALGVPVTKFYEYRPNVGDKKVNVKVEFDNKKENKLGIALPKGKVRVYKKDDDGSLEFVGEDGIDHTPKDEKLTLYIGDAFDIIAETKQFKSEGGNNWSRAGFEVELRNHKAEAIEVRVLVNVGSNYRIEAETIDGQKAEHKAKDAFTLEYRVKVDKNAKAKLAYTVFNNW